MNRELLTQARDALPPRLNAGILMGDGGFCVLGWMLLTAGFHPITLYSNTLGVVHPELGGPAVDVVARVYGLDREAVIGMGELHDATPVGERVDAVRRQITELLDAEPSR